MAPAALAAPPGQRRGDRHRRAGRLRGLLGLGARTGRAGARRAAPRARAAARTDALPAGVDQRPRRGAAALLRPFPDPRLAHRRARARARARAPLGARARAGRVPARAPGLRPVVVPGDLAGARRLWPGTRLHRRAAARDPDRFARGIALRAPQGRRGRTRCAVAHHPSPPTDGDAMRRFVFLCSLVLAACASTSIVDEARQQYAEGRGEDALALLEKTMKERPNDRAVRSEYFRLRDVVLGQWLAQGDALRSAGQFDAAQTLYERVRKYDPGNRRAAAGLAQIETDRA